MIFKSLAVAGLLTCMVTQTASAGFILYNIRNGASGAAGVSGLPNGPYDIAITEGGQKVGLGSSDIDGSKLKNIGNLAITRTDDRTGMAAGPFSAPYLNFWITDGTNYAVVANEPSNAAFQPLFNNGYDLTFADLADKTAKVFENADTSWLPNNGVGLTFADLGELVIQAPTIAELGVGWAGLGTGAPRELGTNVAYGVNWIFGDTLENYVSGGPGYAVSSPSVTAAVPEPSSLVIACCGLVAAGVSFRRRKRAAVAAV
ncbi:hypothetical protein FF011L_06040 [Roseimaritima multifibrata]|uniref:Ice-binding protein C-terminal domain-containing protein n=1 Tax=Roseimaritima multifibrata TaxID=1930274 RepID=A0A517MAG7_9BACT|nr:PEP-CTERM sorting domain-containing protein [Roseimaritima multifibrata]QDS91868.1 hypothetical protein FF011L_06040 [Roseimaritima multifibrata]